MKTNVEKLLIIVVAAVVGSIGCQGPAPFDRSAMLSDIANNHVLPTLSQLEVNVQALEGATVAFINQPNAANLQQAQSNWKTTMETWSQVEQLYFGPGQEKFLYIQLDNTPTAPFFIERVIQDTTVIDSLSIQDRSSYTKGLGSIEYLLFEGNTGRTDLLQQYQTHTNAQRRKAYLLSTVQYTKGLIQTLYNGWRPAGGNFAQTLSEAIDDKMTSGLSRYTNAIIHMSQTMARKKIGKPLGKETKTIDPTLVESPYGAHTYAIIRNNLKGIEAVFGRLEDNRLGAILTDVTGSDAATKRILGELDALAQLLDQRTSTLQQDLINDPAAVEALYQATKSLHEQLKNELTMAFSITILANPDDGD